MKKLLFTIMSFVALVSCSESDVTHTSGEDYSVIHVGNSIPVFSVTASNGTIYTDQSLHGSVSIIVFFNTECNDCRKELPQINTAYKAFQYNKLVRFVAISRAQNANDVALYWTKQGFDIPYSAQSDRSVYNMFATQGIPRIYIADTSGKIRFVSSDTDMPDAATLVDAIKQYLPYYLL
jgi:peroxiredoxin